jgi:hypothetical protein
MEAFSKQQQQQKSPRFFSIIYFHDHILIRSHLKHWLQNLYYVLLNYV